MPQDFALSTEQLAAFERDGVLRLPGLMSSETARRARDVVFWRLTELGLWDKASNRLTGPRPQWPSTGLRPGQVLTSARAEVADLFEDPAVAGIVSAALGGRDLDRTMHPRPQILVSLPNCEEWRTPDGWHTDYPRLASGESPGVQIFAFLGQVEPQGGGTLVLAGSHRLLNNNGALRAKKISRFLRGDAFFRGLYEGRVGSELPEGVVTGVPVRVVELTGAPGDAWLTDLRVLHSASPNAAHRPRMMATHRYVRVDLLAEIAAVFGWEARAGQDSSRALS